MDRVKRIWYLSPMRAAKVQASLRIHAENQIPDPLNGWTCAVEICHDGMLQDTNSLDGAQMIHITWICVMHMLQLSSHNVQHLNFQFKFT